MLVHCSIADKWTVGAIASTAKVLHGHFRFVLLASTYWFNPQSRWRSGNISRIRNCSAVAHTQKHPTCCLCNKEESILWHSLPDSPLPRPVFLCVLWTHYCLFSFLPLSREWKTEQVKEVDYVNLPAVFVKQINKTLARMKYRFFFL